VEGTLNSMDSIQLVFLLVVWAIGMVMEWTVTGSGSSGGVPVGDEQCVDGYVMTLTRLTWMVVRSVSDEFVIVKDRGSDSPIRCSD
jgi:hypothetical protein